MNRAYLFGIVLVAVIGGLLFGYDTAVISGAEKGLQQFFAAASDFSYTDAWHGFTTSSALIGCIIGAFLSGIMAGRLGRKKSLFIAGICFFISAWGSYNPETWILAQEPTKTLCVVFNLYRVLGGIGVGLASAICPMYIAEIAPASRRGALVSWNQFAIIFGQLVVYFVNFLIIRSHIDDPAVQEWTQQVGWRVMFGSECVPAGLFTLLILLVPESPRYLVLTGRDKEALAVLTRINGENKAAKIVEDIRQTVVEKREPLLAYGWLVIFVGIMLSVFQQAVGINAVLYFAPRIFESVGLNNSMIFTVLMGVVNISFTLLAIFTVERIGRKPLLIWGSLLMALGALLFAITNMVTLPAWMSVMSILLYSAAFMFSWGPICWVYMSELFPNTIRSQATAIAVAFQWIFNFIVSSTFVPLYNLSHSMVYMAYGIICLLAALFVYKLVPETKGKTLEQMTALWRSKKLN
ncbi:MAG: D-xylose transporter XylE [Paludibacteraceae bacterium]|nr:D-xylose transporter XylE [Paludibacteraceae bacterium]